MRKFAETELIEGKMKLTLLDGTVVIGESWGILDAQDDDGEDLGYEELVFQVDRYKNSLFIREEDIVKVEKVASV